MAAVVLAAAAASMALEEGEMDVGVIDGGRVEVVTAADLEGLDVGDVDGEVVDN